MVRGEHMHFLVIFWLSLRPRKQAIEKIVSYFSLRPRKPKMKEAWGVGCDEVSNHAHSTDAKWMEGWRKGVQALPSCPSFVFQHRLLWPSPPSPALSPFMSFICLPASLAVTFSAFSGLSPFMSSMCLPSVAVSAFSDFLSLHVLHLSSSIACCDLLRLLRLSLPPCPSFVFQHRLLWPSPPSPALSPFMSFICLPASLAVTFSAFSGLVSLHVLSFVSHRLLCPPSPALSPFMSLHLSSSIACCDLLRLLRPCPPSCPSSIACCDLLRLLRPCLRACPSFVFQHRLLWPSPPSLALFSFMSLHLSPIGGCVRLFRPCLPSCPSFVFQHRLLWPSPPSPALSPFMSFICLPASLAVTFSAFSGLVSLHVLSFVSHRLLCPPSPALSPFMSFICLPASLAVTFSAFSGLVFLHVPSFVSHRWLCPPFPALSPFMSFICLPASLAVTFSAFSGLVSLHVLSFVFQHRLLWPSPPSPALSPLMSIICLPASLAVTFSAFSGLVFIMSFICLPASLAVTFSAFSGLVSLHVLSFVSQYRFLMSVFSRLVSLHVLSFVSQHQLLCPPSPTLSSFISLQP